MGKTENNIEYLILNSACISAKNPNTKSQKKENQQTAKDTKTAKPKIPTPPQGGEIKFL